MGRQYLDMIWLVPIAVLIGVGWFMYRLGIEVGRDRERQDRREADKRRHPSSRQPSNVVAIHRSK